MVKNSAKRRKRTRSGEEAATDPNGPQNADEERAAAAYVAGKCLEIQQRWNEAERECRIGGFRRRDELKDDFLSFGEAVAVAWDDTDAAPLSDRC